MSIQKLFLSLFLVFSIATNAQKNQKDVLFTIDDKPYYTDEFIKVYNKNLELVKDESQKDLSQYLELFVGYKLKVNKANKIGLQNSVQYQNELKSYRNQLSKNYTSDSKVTTALVNEGYERLKKEINAAHILIMVDENAAPADTLVAYKKTLAVRERALKGEDFGKLALELSEDPSAKENNGDLGFFTSFRMVYAFESAAYKTPVGAISMPVRTRFGYHLIKVKEVRDNRGEVSVAHIMIMNAKEGEAAEKPETTIEELYKKIQQGEKFEEVAKQFSEDKSSASKGGVLNRFGSGQLSSEEFESVAFSLTKDNPISKPFKSQFGWHIVKLIEKFPLKSYEESRTELENKIAKDDRSRLITNSLTEKLRKKYVIKRDNKVYTTIEKLVNNDFYDAKWTLPEDIKKYDTRLFSIENKIISGTNFINFINEQQKSGYGTKPIQKLVESLYNKFVDDQINIYYNDNLEGEFPEFASVMEEYRDGLLLFDLMEKEIWQRSKSDTLGLRTFHSVNKNKYLWKNRVKIIVASSTNIDVMKKALTMIKKDVLPQTIKEKLNTKEVVNIMIVEGTFEEGADAIPKGTKFEKGISEITKQGEYYFVTKVLETIPSEPKSFEDSRGRIVNDYQQYLEQNWVSELKKEFQVKINTAVFENVKKELKK
jgi:peptidyl-prolyl cis-trans isomerase SurA